MNEDLQALPHRLPASDPLALGMVSSELLLNLSGTLGPWFGDTPSRAGLQLSLVMQARVREKWHWPSPSSRAPGPPELEGGPG